MPSREEVLAAWGERERFVRRLGDGGASRLPFLAGQAAPKPKPGTRHIPLFPYPNNTAGARLFELSGWPLGLWMRGWDRFNTLEHFPGSAGKGDAFPLPLARAAARRHVDERGLVDRCGLIVGKANAGCYPWPGGLPDPFTVVRIGEASFWMWVPHTSGVNTFWNDPDHRGRFRQALQAYKALVNLISLENIAE